MISQQLLVLIPICLYVIVGIISLTMAYKNLFSKRFLPFHEKVSNATWDEIGAGAQDVVLALMKVSGLGFLIVGLTLIIFPVVNYFENDPFVRYAIPLLALIYCIGLSIINFFLFVRSQSNTPWKRSIYAAIIIGIAVIVSML